MVKRKRPLLKPCVQKQEEGEPADRKVSSRQTKRAKSFYMNDNEGDGKKDGGVTKENGIWFVTCEKKAGIMDIEKLKRGENCIECDGLWFSPPAFEEFAGKGACKKWKFSIYHEGRPLTHWFAKGILSTTGYMRRGTETTRKIKVPSIKKESKPTKTLRTFQGVKSSKYRRSSTSAIQQNSSSKGCILKKRAEIKPTEHPEGGGIEADKKDLDSNARIVTDQENRDGWNERNNGQTINSKDAADKKQDDPNQSKTDNGCVLAAANPPKDQSADKERCQDVGVTKGEKRKTKVKGEAVIKRLSELYNRGGGLRRRACKTIRHPQERRCEPLEETAHVEETKDDKAVSEALREENVKEFNDGEKPSTSSALFTPLLVNGDKTGLSAAPQSLLLQCVYKDTDEPKTEHEEVKWETSGTGIQISDCHHASETLEDQASGEPGGSDVDGMDLEQLKREKIKMQLRVLKLQEEYYTFMLKDLKK